jgi:hypothetical protein
MSAAQLMVADMAHGVALSAMSRTLAMSSAAHRRDVTEAYCSVAEQLSEKYALREALRKFDPNHPLLVDADLREKIQEAGRDQYQSTTEQTWTDVGRAGLKVKYDYTPTSGGAEVATLKRQLAETESANIQNLVEKHALRTALKRVDKSHPLIRPDSEQNMLVAALRKAGLMAYSFGGYDAVGEAGRTFRYPENMLWGQRESVLEAYPGEIEALEKRIAFLRSPEAQRAHLALKAQAGSSPA